MISRMPSQKDGADWPRMAMASTSGAARRPGRREQPEPEARARRHPPAPHQQHQRRAQRRQDDACDRLRE
jgi:hypothetical protein